MIPSTPANCRDSQRLRGFLRLSRIATDDTIRTHLNEIKRGDCDLYFQKTILDQWNARARLIEYCNTYAKTLRREISMDNQQSPEFDLRLDPYAQINHKNDIHQKYAQAETIENWVENEKSVELILREQSVKVLNEKCYYKDWLQEFNDASKTL